MLHHMLLSSLRCADGEVAALLGEKKKITERRQKQWSVQISDRNQISESEGHKKRGEERKKWGTGKLVKRINISKKEHGSAEGEEKTKKW